MDLLTNNPQIQKIQDEIEAKKAQKEALEGQIELNTSITNNLTDECVKIRMEAQAKIDALNERKKTLNAETFDMRRQIRALEAEINSLEAKLRLAIDALMQMDKFKIKAEEFNKRTASAPWREWAFDYQLEGATLMACNDGRAINADKMGLGKSIQSLIACDMLGSKRILVVCPSPLVNNFVREVKKWAPHRVPINMKGMSKNERYATINMMKMIGGPICVVINYEAWRRDWKLVELLTEMRFDTAICDEFNKVKNPSTNAARGLESIVLGNNVCPECGKAAYEQTQGAIFIGRCSACDWETRTNSIGRHRDINRRSVKYVFPMSGTPVLNRPDELYFSLHLTIPEVFYDIEVFRGLYCYQDYDGKWRWRPNGVKDLEQHLQGRYVARTKKDVGINLPPQETNIVELEFDKEKYPNQWRIIEQVHKHAQIVLESGESTAMMEIIAIITRKRQANVCPAGIKIWEKIRDEEGKVIDKRLVLDVGEEVTESIKLDYAYDLITDVTADGNKEAGERVVVLSQFKAPLHELNKRLNDSGITAVVYDGDTAPSIRTGIELDFDRSVRGTGPYHSQVLLTNYATGGVGLNFTAATQVIILDEPWNPGTLEQALARVDRVGQTEKSTVTIIRIKDSIDDWLADILEDKKGIVDSFEQRGRELTQFLTIAMNNGEVL